MSLLLVNVNVVCYDVQLFSLSLVVATLYYGGHLVMNNLISGADLVAFVLYGWITYGVPCCKIILQESLQSVK